MRRAGGGGVQAVETIGNSAPERGSRELAVVIVALMLSDHPTVPILHAQINNLVRTLPPEVRDRLPQGALPEHRTATFRQKTVDAIVALSQLGYAEALRTATARSIPSRANSEPHLTYRRRWLENLRLHH